MTKAGKIKTLIIAPLAIMNLIYTIPPSKTEIAYSALSFFLAGLVGVLLSSVFKATISRERFERPSWNDKYFTGGNVLSNYLFIAMFFTSIGLCSSTKTVLIYKGFNLMGAVSFAFGTGILIATYLSYILFRSKLNLNKLLDKNKT